ncbi:MAG: hypothetical protein IIC55_00540 [Proteobacteria bacterium]|nr:hypothetical protein [Pseudomonadota bacterium]
MTGKGEEWAGFVTTLDGAKWSTEAPLPNSTNHLDNRPALAPLPGGGVLAVHSNDGPRVKNTFSDNDLYATTGEAASLACAIDHIQGDCFISYGDILFRQHYLDQLMAGDGDITLAVDALWKERKSDAEGWVRDLVSCSRPFSDDYLDDDPVTVKRIGNEIDPGEVDGEWIGVARLSRQGSEWVRAEIEAMGEDATLPQSSMLDLLQRLVDKGMSIRAVYVPGQWLDVDDAADFTRADKFL